MPSNGTLAAPFVLGVDTIITTVSGISPLYGYYPVVIAIEDPVTNATRVILQVDSTAGAAAYNVTQDTVDAYSNGQVGDRIHILGQPCYVADQNTQFGGDNLTFFLNVKKDDVIVVGGWSGLANPYGSNKPTDSQANTYTLRATNTGSVAAWDTHAKADGTLSIFLARNPGTAVQMGIAIAIRPADTVSFRYSSDQPGYIDHAGGTIEYPFFLPTGITGMPTAGGFRSNGAKITFALTRFNAPRLAIDVFWIDANYTLLTTALGVVTLDFNTFGGLSQITGIPKEQTSWPTTNGAVWALHDYFYGLNVDYTAPLQRDSGRTLQRAFKAGLGPIFGASDQEYPSCQFPYVVNPGNTIIVATNYMGGGSDTRPAEPYDDYGNVYTQVFLGLYGGSAAPTVAFYKTTALHTPTPGQPFIVRTRVSPPKAQFEQSSILLGIWELDTTGASVSFSGYHTGVVTGTGPFTGTTPTFTAPENSYILGIYGTVQNTVGGGPPESFSANSGFTLPYQWILGQADNNSSPFIAHAGTGFIAEQYTAVDLTTDFAGTSNGVGFGGVLVMTVTPTPTAACPTPNVLSVGTFYSLTIPVSGGTPPYTFALTAGSLPPGMSLNTSTGVISGTPTTIGEYDWTIRITDSNGAFTDISCSLTAGGNPCVDNTPDENDNAFTLLRVIPTSKGAARTPVRGKS